MNMPRHVRKSADHWRRMAAIHESDSQHLMQKGDKEGAVQVGLAALRNIDNVAAIEGEWDQ